MQDMISYNILTHIFYHVDTEDLNDLKKFLINCDKQVIEIIDSFIVSRYIYYNYSLAEKRAPTITYGKCGPVIIDAPNLETAWKIALFYEYKNVASLEYTFFDMRDIKISLGDSNVELSGYKKHSEFFKTHFPEYYYNNEPTLAHHALLALAEIRFPLFPRNAELMGDWILSFSYEDFYKNLDKLKYLTIHDSTFDDPFPSWEYSLQLATIKKGDPYLIMNIPGNSKFKYRSSKNNIGDAPYVEIEQNQWERSYFIADLTQLSLDYLKNFDE